jgi:hypothetical protein
MKAISTKNTYNVCICTIYENEPYHSFLFRAMYSLNQSNAQYYALIAFNELIY